jgi:hypothetical protein
MESVSIAADSSGRPGSSSLLERVIGKVSVVDTIARNDSHVGNDRRFALLEPVTLPVQIRKFAPSPGLLPRERNGLPRSDPRRMLRTLRRARQGVVADTLILLEA